MKLAPRPPLNALKADTRVMSDQLSPTSVLRLNFENLLAETTDPGGSHLDEGAAEALWGVVTTTLPEFVRSHRVMSWIEEGLHTPPVFFRDVLCLKKVSRNAHHLYGNGVDEEEDVSWW